MPQYSVRAQTSRKPHHLPFGLRERILARDGNECAYCHYLAEEVDHIIPYSYGGSDDEENLVACCTICNRIAGNKVFASFVEKRIYIRTKYGPHLIGRARRLRKKLSICGDCDQVFTPRQAGSSAVLCASCYKLSTTGLRQILQNEQSVQEDIEIYDPFAAYEIRPQTRLRAS